MKTPPSVGGKYTWLYLLKIQDVSQVGQPNLLRRPKPNISFARFGDKVHQNESYLGTSSYGSSYFYMVHMEREV